MGQLKSTTIYGTLRVTSTTGSTSISTGSAVFAGGVGIAEKLYVGNVIVASGNVTAPIFISNVATGTAPLTVTSTTAVSNFNSDYLDGQHGSYYTTAGNLSGTIPSAVLGNSSLYVGTTQIALNRASATQSLTGITSIDGSAATLTTSRNFSISSEATATAVGFNGSANVDLAVTLSNSAVIGKVLTGYTATSGTIAATDTILQAIQKLGYDKHVAVTLATNSGLTLSTQQLAMGTPTGLSGTSTNSVTTSTHSHAITGAALTKVDDTNVTITLGGSSSTALLNAASITLGWSGLLAASRGGTGVNNSYTLTITGANKTLAGAGGTLTLGASPTINGSGTLALTSNATFTTALTVNTGAVTISGQSGGSTLNLPTSLTINALTSGHVLYASAANTISGEAQLAATRGGTGYGSYTVGDLLYASSTTALARLNAVAAGSALISAGTSTAPTWGKIDLGTHTTGTLGVGSGGTGATSFTTDQILYGNGSNAIASSANLMWASSSFLLTAASSAINNYATSSTALAAPEGVTITAKNSGAGDGKFAGITFQSANAAGLYSSIYMGVVSTAAGNTSPFVIGRKTGATAYTESLRINESGDVSILSTTTSSAYTSGALLVSGGVGVSGALNVNGAIATNSTLTTGNRITVDYGATGGDSTWDKSGILIKNMNGTSSEVALALQNASTTASNYWIVGLNQSEVLKYAYGNSFTDALTLSSLDTSGNFTTYGNIYGASVYLEEDANSTYYLRLFNNSALSANRTLTINVNNADRTIDIAGNLTVFSTASVSGTNTGDVTLATNSGLAFTSGQTGLALGTPTGLSGTSTNSVTTSTHSHAITGAALTKSDDTNVTLTLGGSATAALLNAASITAGWTGQLSLARGGTNANLTASNGGIVYSTGSALAILAGTATASKMLLSGASTTPTWSTSTIPTSAGSTAGKYLVSDGTNYVLSSYTLTLGANTTINTSTANYAAYYSGTNAISGEQYLAVSRGGTGIGSYAVGDLLYASGATTLSKLADVATGNALISGGVTTAPSWGKIGLTTHVSGILPLANGGTGVSTAFTAGSVIFANGSGLAQDNANLFWDDINNRLGVGTAVPGFTLEVSGAFAATTKSFIIPHPLKEGKRLRYSSLEGPENGVYIRGRLTGDDVIELPDYWTKLVDPNTIAVNVTSIGVPQRLYVKKVENNKVYLGIENTIFSRKQIDCFYMIFAERADVEKLQVEI